jgi:hypothetical protein
LSFCGARIERARSEAIGSYRLNVAEIIQSTLPSGIHPHKARPIIESISRKRFVVLFCNQPIRPLARHGTVQCAKAFRTGSSGRTIAWIAFFSSNKRVR